VTVSAEVMSSPGPAIAEPVASTPEPQRPLATREFLLVSLMLLVLGTIVYAPHVRHGGFYLDDWSNGAEALYPPAGSGIGGVLSSFAKLTLYRPVLVLYVPLTYLVFGTHMAFQLAWAVMLAIFASAMLYGVLRTLGVPRLHATLLAALVLVYPWFDATRLWETASQATLSIGFTFAGLWLALVGIRRRSWRLHCGAMALYLTSILTYEVTLPLIAAAGGLYTVRSGWRASRARWGGDLITVLAGGLWVGTQTSRESRGISADVRHLKEIVTSGGTMLGRTLLPIGEQRTTPALVAFFLILIIGLVANLYFRGHFAQRAGWGLREWLLLAGAGLLVAVLGWIMYIPANPYYTPSVYGFTDRVNALAGFGLVIAVYAVLGIAVSLVGTLLPRRQAVIAMATIVCGLLLGLAYVRVLERHIRIWNTAFRAEMAGIGEMRMQFPHLPPGTTVFTSDYPAYQTLGVPIFSTDWDVNGMVKLQYKDGTLSAYPVLPGLLLVCRADGVGLQGAGAPAVTAAYGAVRFLNVHTGQHAQPRSKRACDAVVRYYTPGPLYLSLSY
jgi:hypothetical protein